jgi:hypothetical protein
LRTESAALRQTPGGRGGVVEDGLDRGEGLAGKVADLVAEREDVLGFGLLDGGGESRAFLEPGVDGGAADAGGLRGGGEGGSRGGGERDLSLNGAEGVEGFVFYGRGKDTMRSRWVRAGWRTSPLLATRIFSTVVTGENEGDVRYARLIGSY